MKQALYALFALFCNLSRLLFPLKENRSAFVSMHNEELHDSLGAVREAMAAEGFETVILTRRDLSSRHPLGVLRFFFVRARQLVTAKYVFLNDNFMPLGQIRFRRETILTQLWHAEGAFKKFGFAIEQPSAVRKREAAGNAKLTWVVCSSKAVAPIYAEAFGVSEKQVLPLGAPRADRLLAPGAQREAKAALLRLYPELQGKTLVLWAPTFRDDPADNDNLLRQMDMDAFRNTLGKDYALLLRLHPQIHPDLRQLSGALDLTDYSDVMQLILACDVLVTDYSSVCMTAALLQKKTVFFAFDLEKYCKTRDFYYPYESYVPGPVAVDCSGLLAAISAPFDKERNERFCARNFDFRDCGSTQRVIAAVVKKQKNN